MRSLAYAALWVFVFSVPWERVLVIPGVGVISRLTGMVAVGATLLAVVMSARIRRWQGFHVAALLFVIWAGAILWVNSDAPDLPLKFWTYAQLFLVLWMVWELGPTRRHQLGLLLAYVLGSYVTALETIMMFRRHGGGMRRFAAGEADPNAMAMILALALPMAWYLGITYRQPLLRWICRGYLPVGLLALGLTGSRGGLVAGMVGLLIVPLSMAMSPARLTMAIAVLGLSGLLAVAYLPETIMQRFATTRESVEDLTLGGRLRIWRAGVRAFAQRPLTGYGTGGFKRATSPWMGGEERVAHNSYLSVMVEQGLVGFLLYSAMFVAVVLALLNLPPPERRFALVQLAALMTAMLPLTWEDSKPVWFILAVLLGLAKAQVPWRGRLAPQTGPRIGAPVAVPPRGVRPRPPLTGPVRNDPRPRG
jgi:O-antigen ligase